MPNERTDVRELGGLTEEQIRLMVEPLAARVMNLEKMICANGRPSLEDRVREDAQRKIDSLKDYVDAKDTHKDNNAKQMASDLRCDLEEDRARQDKRHEANLKRFGLLENKIAYATGAAMVITILAQHYWK